MKIKRFEASNMTEALRMIKKEFGEDAVILSAKTMQKSSGLLGSKRPRKVVVTAAIDHEPAAEPDVAATESIEQEARGRSSAGTGDSTYSKFSFLKNYRPITRTGKNKVKPKIVQFMAETTETSDTPGIEGQLLEQGMSADYAAELAAQVDSLLASDHASEKEKGKALAQALDAMQVVKPVRLHGGSTPRVIVIAGPAGVGKTSAVVKLAATHIIEHQETVAVISLDNQRIAAAAELERYAAIMGVELKTAQDADAAARVLKTLDTADLVVVDTPGLGLDDHYPLQLLKNTLSALGDIETHLLLSAAVQEKVMARTISFFKPLQVDRLMFTKLDWAVDIGPMINRVMASKLPMAYLCDSPKVPEGVHVATAIELSALLLSEDSCSQMGRERKALTVSQRTMAQQTACYVANRNSDIFHHNSCKSVKRIHTDNMILFKNPAEAMGQQFKPCRMCCSELMVTKPIERPVRHYAGNRC
jgi:flagellar biosynthesis protein FlhF